MAKTFVQLIGLLVMLGVVISITTMSSGESLLGLFVFSIPFLGFAMMWISIKAGWNGLFQNKELFFVGVASLILGATKWVGDSTIAGFSLNDLGLAIAIGTELFLLFEVILLWEAK